MPQAKKIFLTLCGIAIIFTGIDFYLNWDKEIDTIEIVEEVKKKEASFAFIIEGEEDTPLLSPIDVAVAEDGTLYVTDSDHNRIQVFDKDGTFLFHFGAIDDLEENEGKSLNYPVNIALDKEQNVYVVDLLNQRIAIFTKDGDFIDDFTPIDGLLVDPSVITIENNFIYIFDKFDHQIKKFTTDGELVLTFGEQGNAKGQLQYPFDIAVTKDEKIYVADTGNGRIQVFNQMGTYKSLIKSTDGMPSGIAIDADNLYIADPMNNVVVIASKAGKRLSTISTLGLYFPEGIEVVDDRLYIVDKGNNRVIVMNLQ